MQTRRGPPPPSAKSQRFTDLQERHAMTQISGIKSERSRQQCLAADEADAPKDRAHGGEGLLFQYRRGLGHLIAGEETAVRPGQGLKVAEILTDAGDTVTAGQTLAWLLREGDPVRPVTSSADAK
jgi:hypothetical protein